MIQWNKYFDHIYCIHSTLYPERIPNLINEFTRVGILDSDIFSWKISSGDFISHINYNDIDYVFGCEESSKTKFIDLTKNYVEIFEDSLLNNYQKILVMEDDLYFLKDLSLIEEILDNLPDFDICKFDWNCFFTYLNQDQLGPNTIYDVGSINDYYCYYTWTTSSGIVGYSNRMMQLLLYNIKGALQNYSIIPFDNFLARLCDTDGNNPFNLRFFNYYYDRESFLNQFNEYPEVLKILLSKKHIAMQIADSSLNKNTSITNNETYYFPSDFELAEKYGEMYKIDITEYNYITE